jgi:hypothetical protein
MKQTETLLALAKRKDVFLMEAVWTRYMPIAKDIERLVRDEKVIGDVRRVYGDLSMDFKIHDLPEGHRMTSADMAGGGLLDLGPYPLLWTLLTLSGPEAKPPSRVSSNIQFTNLPNVKDQVDAQTCFTLNWDDEGAQAICTTSITSEASNHAVIIQGTRGTSPDAYAFPKHIPMTDDQPYLGSLQAKSSSIDPLTDPRSTPSELPRRVHPSPPRREKSPSRSSRGSRRRLLDEACTGALPSFPSSLALPLPNKLSRGSCLAGWPTMWQSVSETARRSLPA